MPQRGMSGKLSLAYNKKIAKDNVIVHRDRVGLVKG